MSVATLKPLPRTMRAVACEEVEAREVVNDGIIREAQG
jgi:hypothetical protein